MCQLWAAMIYFWIFFYVFSSLKPNLIEFVKINGYWNTFLISFENINSYWDLAEILIRIESESFTELIVISQLSEKIRE